MVDFLVDVTARPSTGANATRLFTASYNVTVSPSGQLDDWIAAGDTNVYVQVHAWAGAVAFRASRRACWGL